MIIVSPSPRVNICGHTEFGWSRLKDARIRWFDIQKGEVESEIEAQVAEFISGE